MLLIKEIIMVRFIAKSLELKSVKRNFPSFLLPSSCLPSLFSFLPLLVFICSYEISCFIAHDSYFVGFRTW